MHKLTIKNLRKAFKDHLVLKDINFTANKGDVIALMGGSGSGKSTLLRCINLLTIPDAGSLQIDTQLFQFPAADGALNNKAVNQLRCKVGMVFQQFNLWAHMTVLDNLIAAPIYVLKKEKKQMVEEAKFLLKKVGLENKIHHYPSQLSGGQQQRAAIARALMMKPEIMLFDEPTSALDPEMVGEVLSVMQQLAHEGMTMLVATHEISFARRVANHCMFLEDGKILEKGEAHSMFVHPQTERFQQFLAAVHQ